MAGAAVFALRSGANDGIEAANSQKNLVALPTARARDAGEQEDML